MVIRQIRLVTVSMVTTVTAVPACSVVWVHNSMQSEEEMQLMRPTYCRRQGPPDEASLAQNKMVSELWQTA